MLTRSELLEMGFSEAAIASQLGDEPKEFDRDHIVHVWKTISSNNKKVLTAAQDELLSRMIAEYNRFGEYQLPKLKYKIEG